MTQAAKFDCFIGCEFNTGSLAVSCQYKQRYLSAQLSPFYIAQVEIPYDLAPHSLSSYFAKLK